MPTKHLPFKKTLLQAFPALLLPEKLLPAKKDCCFGQTVLILFAMFFQPLCHIFQAVIQSVEALLKGNKIRIDYRRLLHGDALDPYRFCRNACGSDVPGQGL